jgi:solute carrier family 25 folate transporter 32
MAYEQLKNHWSTSRGGRDNLTNLDFLLLSAVSKMFAGSATYPYQVVRARLQTYDADSRYKGVRDVVKQVFQKEGLKGFYKGYVLDLCRRCVGS